nr:cbb3-type cytochrome c oxidase subunit I [Azospirillum sp. INR13]
MTLRTDEPRDEFPGGRTTPSPIPRPPGEEEELLRLWRLPQGIARVTAVNNTKVGVWYIGTALLFFLIAGVLALVMRLQLAMPGNDLLDHGTYNQFFTVHGTGMMFLFAVPIVEAIGVFLLPSMLAARDLPFPGCRPSPSGPTSSAAYSSSAR